MYFTKAETKAYRHLPFVTLGFVQRRAQNDIVPSLYVDSEGIFRFQQGFTKGQETEIKPFWNSRTLCVFLEWQWCQQ